MGEALKAVGALLLGVALILSAPVLFALMIVVGVPFAAGMNVLDGIRKDGE